MRRYAYIVCLYLLVPALVHAQDIHNRMTIVEAIEVVRATGQAVFYSTGLVEEWMRVRKTPQAAEPVAALEQALAAYYLALEPDGDNRWLIVKAAVPVAERPSPAAAPAPSAAVTAVAEPPPLDEITIVASRHSMYAKSTADQFLSGDEIRLMPHVADDAFRAFHRLPGAAANDFQGPFNLRGGSVDEVQVLLNGVELFEPFHMRTLFQPLSIIDAGIIEEAQVFSGGFTAKHGNHLSGVIDISTQRSQAQPVHELGVSFVSAFARSKGRFANGRGSYFLSARRGYLDLVADRVTEEGEELEPRYGDLFADLSYDLNDKVSLSLQTLIADDDVTFVDDTDGEEFHEDSTLRYLWLTADIEPVAGVTSRNTLFFGQVDTLENGGQINLPSESIVRYYDRDVAVAGLQSDWVVPLGERQLLEFGARFRDLQADFDYRLSSVRRSDFVNNGAPFAVNRNLLVASSGDDISAYASFRQRLHERFIWELGLRWDRQTYMPASGESQVSPRLNLAYELNDRIDLMLAWGRYHQPQAIQDLDLPDGDSTYYTPGEAEHRIVGLRYAFASGLELQADFYDKRYDQLRPRYENLLDIYEFAPESNFDRTKIEPQSGRVYGAELTLRNRGSSPLDWWANYTWSKAHDRINGVNVLRSWDQRHAVTASVAWRGERWSISAIARYHSGWPRTPLLVEPVLGDNENIVGIDVDLTERNSRSFNDYSRFDVRVSRYVPLKRGSFEYYLEIFNIFNSKNQCCTSNHTLSIGSSINVSPKFVEFLPLFPSFGFVWRFGPGAATTLP